MSTFLKKYEKNLVLDKNNLTQFVLESYNYSACHLNTQRSTMVTTPNMAF